MSVALMLAVYAPDLFAQRGEPMATLADSSTIAKIWRDGAFNGIALSRADSALAYRICLSAIVARLRVPANDPNRNARIMQLDDQRDALLLKLVKSSKDSALFMQNFMRFRMRPVAPAH
jgi:hypothetical protein